jgi:hypothetical protein
MACGKSKHTKTGRQLGGPSMLLDQFKKIYDNVLN